MSHGNQNTKAALANEIKRQSHSAENRRFLRSIPLFDVELTLPDRLRELLAQLEDVEPTPHLTHKPANQ